MNVDLRPPNITATTPEAKIGQLQSYLVYLSSQLQYAFYSVEQKEKEYLEKKEESDKAISPEKEAESTFNSIKSLIIKSADIVKAYSEEISRELSGTYVAQSEFGTFSEQTEANFSLANDGIEQNYNNIQQIISDLDEIDNAILDVSASIRTGVLDYDEDGLPIYGLEIGQKNTVNDEEVFNKYARFTSDRLSFYDRNDIEVAYISDFKLYITEAQITGNLTLGGYEIDTSDGLIFRWAGD